jgi:hypothetical protein
MYHARSSDSLFRSTGPLTTNASALALVNQLGQYLDGVHSGLNSRAEGSETCWTHSEKFRKCGRSGEADHTSSSPFPVIACVVELRLISEHSLPRIDTYEFFNHSKCSRTGVE